MMNYLLAPPCADPAETQHPDGVCTTVCLCFQRELKVFNTIFNMRLLLLFLNNVAWFQLPTKWRTWK